MIHLLYNVVIIGLCLDKLKTMSLISRKKCHKMPCDVPTCKRALHIVKIHCNRLYSWYWILFNPEISKANFCLYTKNKKQICTLHWKVNGSGRKIKQFQLGTLFSEFQGKWRKFPNLKGRWLQAIFLKCTVIVTIVSCENIVLGYA